MLTGMTGQTKNLKIRRVVRTATRKRNNMMNIITLFATKTTPTAVTLANHLGDKLPTGRENSGHRIVKGQTIYKS